MARAPMRLGGLLAACLVGLAALLASVDAWAHAALVGSEPGDGAVLADAPTGFRLRFNEPVAVTALSLVGAGATTPLEAAGPAGALVEIRAPAELRAGRYALSYRVVSEDGHPVSGAVAFAVGTADAASLQPMGGSDSALRFAIWAARAALYVGLLFGAGGAFACAFLADRKAHGRRAVTACAWIGLAASPLSLALLGADLEGASLEGAFSSDLWRQAASTSYGLSAGLASAALGLSLASLSMRGAPARALALPALLGVGLALAASGHASAATPQPAMRAVVFAHGVAAAVWLGALPGLLLALTRDPAAANLPLRRFAALAPLAVLALAASGAILAIRQTETVEALWTTDYGRVLSAKLALVGALLALAALNRWRWTAPMLRGDGAAAENLRRSVAIELVLGAVILGVVALWRFTPPPRAIVAAGEPAFVHMHAREAQADVTLEPGRAGRAARLSILVTTADSGPLDAKELTIVLSNAAAGVEPIRRSASKRAGGLWTVDGLALPAAGRWTLRLDLLISEFDLEKLEAELEVRP